MLESSSQRRSNGVCETFTGATTFKRHKGVSIGPAAAIAAPSRAEVEELIRAAVQTAVTDINDRFGALLREQVSRQDAESALTLVIGNASRTSRTTACGSKISAQGSTASSRTTRM